MSMPADAKDRDGRLEDRVFLLLWQGAPMARLRSRGSFEMFWESFRVEPLAGGDLPDKLFDPGAWDRCEFSLRHERTGTVLVQIFSPPNLPPARAADGAVEVSLRGTYGFDPPAPGPVGRLRAFVRGLFG